jgi:hypothetical protein
MKRILPFVLFSASVIVWATLEPGSSSMLRALVLAVIAGLTLWKAVDFWKRLRDEDQDGEDTGEAIGSPDRTS